MLGEEAENAHKTDKLKDFKSIDKNKTDPTVYPFPKYYDEASAQEKWIGNQFPAIPEVKFINDLLAGMIAAVKKETAVVEFGLPNLLTKSTSFVTSTLWFAGPQSNCPANAPAVVDTAGTTVVKSISE